MGSNNSNQKNKHQEIAAYTVIAAKNVGLDVNTAYRLAQEMNRLNDAGQINPEFKKLLLKQSQNWFAANPQKKD